MNMAIKLGACWPAGGTYFGPTLPIGADGGSVLLLLGRPSDGKGQATAVVALNKGDFCYPHSAAHKFSSIMRKANLAVEERNAVADDVASFQVRLGALGNGCASTGIFISQVHVWGAWVTTDHALSDVLAEAVPSC